MARDLGHVGVHGRAGIIEIADAVTEPGFGTPCTSDDDCTQRVCVHHRQHRARRPATRPTPAPTTGRAGRRRRAPRRDDGRPASYCVSPFWALCRPCSGDSACASIASEDPGSCVDYLGAGAFCATACNDDSACPDGFSCSEVETLGGATARRCINTTGMCPCTPYLERLGEPTRCTKADDWGECVGQRTCADGLWSACDARDAAPDVENGQDDDCDGQTDELACACGDDVCDGACGETTANCPCDCAVEGDGVCSPCGESPLTSPTDCCKSPSGTTGCGDGFCMGFGCGESPANCPDDCGHACGDDVCEPGESPYTCPDDCAHKVCGNHVCESTDGGPDKCPQDCDAFCGDCVCDPARDEAVFNCPIDCGYCGDGDCSLCAVLHETEATCAVDCCVPSPEFCNGEDEDCDGQTDEEGAIGCHDFYRDADGDGLGARGETRCLCAPDGAWSASAAGD
ncbi:MAG: hypothetical protein U1F43_38915, partial [Myxococcota bacterium]